MHPPISLTHGNIGPHPVIGIRKYKGKGLKEEDVIE
jgi:hypothetical protein